jgi:hypothetical protein
MVPLYKGSVRLFIYIGNDYVLRSNNIIAIFDLELMKNSGRMQNIMRENRVNDTISGEKKDAKSMILTDTHVYYSPLSTLTLKNRNELYDTT